MPDEIVKLKKLRGKYDKIKSSSEFVKHLSKIEKALYEHYRKSFVEVTNNKLTPAEYHQLAVISLYLDKFDVIALKMGIENVPPKLADLARRYRHMILEVMRTTRRQQERQESFLDELKKEVKEHEDLEFTSPDDIKLDDLEIKEQIRDDEFEEDK